MAKTVGVKFTHTLKVLEFISGDKKLNIRDLVVLETAQGLDIGRVVYVEREVNNKAAAELKEVIRVATKEDIKKSQELEKEALDFIPIFVEKIKKYALKMTPIGAGISLDETKVIFYFSAEGRVDFRELARELSRTIQKQAIMRQIGPRDEAKLIGGYGRCGLPICCSTFLTATESVTMETVELQYGMPKNANKVSGVCGRLMCCLNYEIPEKKSNKQRKIK